MGTGFRNVWQEDGAVVVSETGENTFIFSTIDTPWGDWEHPVSGHREFGVEERPDGTFVFTHEARTAQREFWIVGCRTLSSGNRINCGAP
jgi:hypothetical protein